MVIFLCSAHVLLDMCCFESSLQCSHICTAWDSTSRHITAQHGTAQHGTAQHSAAQRSTTQQLTWQPVSCRELSKELRINVLGYDYSGYGRSTGNPSVSNAIADINACYQFLLQVKGKRPQEIVVYGQSVGSGPSCDLGAAEKDLKGIVLHSPLMSGNAPNLLEN